MENRNREIHDIKEYSDSVLYNTDRYVLGKDLLIRNPLNDEKRLTNVLELRLSLIKQYLETENGYGMNMMKFVLSNKDRNNVNLLAHLVDMYTEHVERQYVLYKDEGLIKTNYFDHELSLRENELYKHYNELCNYLLSLDTIELVWGSFNAKEKNRLYDSKYSDGSEYTNYKDNVINSVAKYMTIDEAIDKNQRIRAYNRIFK